MALSHLVIAILALRLFKSDATSTKSVHYIVQEECDPGTYIGNPVRDASINLDDKAPLFIQLMFGKKDIFLLNETTGDLRTTQHLDRESLCSRVIQPPRPRSPRRSIEREAGAEVKYANVVVPSHASPQKCQVELSVVVRAGDDLLETWINVHIVVQDLNDNRPFFEEDAWNLTLSELTTVGSTFRLPQAIDMDEPEHSILRYGLVDESTPASCRQRFSITCRSEVLFCDLRLVLEKPVDFEHCQQHNLVLFAEDSGYTKAVLPLYVKIRNENEHQPRFIQPTTQLTVPRDSQVGVIITRFHAEDEDGGQDGTVAYTTNSSFFQVADGKLTLTRSLLHYSGDRMNVFVTASDAGSPPRHATIRVVVEVTGQEAEAGPLKISVKPLGGEAVTGPEAPLVIPISAEKGTFVALLWTDGGASKISCSLQPNISHFFIEETGLLMGKPTFTLKVRQSYNFTEKFNQMNSLFEGRDVRVVCASSQMRLRLRLARPPGQQFRFPEEQVRVHVDESSSPILGFYTLVPLNGVGEVRFARDRTSVNCDQVHIHPKLGTLSIPFGIDREHTPELKCRFSASDSDKPPSKIYLNLLISVGDINDCAPALSKLVYTVPEFDSFAESNTLPLWVPLLKINPIDPDAGLNGSVSVELRGASTFGNVSENTRIPELRLSSESGEVSVRAKDYPLLDREEIAGILLFIYLCDFGSPFRLSATYEVKVYLEDVNDNSPVFFDANSKALLENMPWYRSTNDPKPGFWTQISVFDPDQGENGTTVLTVVKGRQEDPDEPRLQPHQVTIFDDGRVWVAEEVVRGASRSVAHLRATDRGSRRQLHSDAKLIVDPTGDQTGRHEHSRPLVPPSHRPSARRIVQIEDKATASRGPLSNVHIILLFVGVGLVCCILASVCIGCLVLRK
uniref:Cadherin domain-containing protein n=1 Tax=Mesocestoides corti TaxID=53468 RepID=A0A5K3FQS4_MESCO